MAAAFHTGFRSASRSPTVTGDFMSKGFAGRPSMSTTMTNFTPVLVNQPYMASRSSTAWSNPKSWSTVLWGRRASNMSRHDDRRNWNSKGARSSSAGNKEMWRGLFYPQVNPVVDRILGSRCMLTCLPITPMHAIEGTRFDMLPRRDRYCCDPFFLFFPSLAAAV